MHPRHSCLPALVLLLTASLGVGGVAEAAKPTNRAKITGTPATTIEAGQAYSFTPTVGGMMGSRLVFSVQGKPAWAYFSTATGTLSGTPSTASVGTHGPVTITATDGRSSATLAPFSITVTQPTTTATTQPAANTAPKISGTPQVKVIEGQPYAFQPQASDAEGGSLTFSIQNKPAWASFSTASGRLEGVPPSGTAGTYASIVISVSDGQASSALPAFSITVEGAAVVADRHVTINWQPPATNTDGTPLTDLAGYRVLYGSDPSKLSQSVTVYGASVTSCTLEQLPAGTVYVAMQSFNSAGITSDLSSVVSKTL